MVPVTFLCTGTTGSPCPIRVWTVFFLCTGTTGSPCPIRVWTVFFFTGAFFAGAFFSGAFFASFAANFAAFRAARAARAFSFLPTYFSCPGFFLSSRARARSRRFFSFTSTHRRGFCVTSQ